MESKRQQKVARKIQKDLSDIFQKEGRSWFDNAFITVTIVRMSPDLGLARVYLSFLVTKNATLMLVRHQLRIVPELAFYMDDTAEYAAKIETLFAGIEIPKADDNG